MKEATEMLFPSESRKIEVFLVFTAVVAGRTRTSRFDSIGFLPREKF